MHPYQFLDPYNPNIIGDDQYVSRVYFKNKYIEITRDRVHSKEYIELEGAVYKSEIIDFAMDDTILFSDYKDSDFYIFLECICDNGDIEVDEDKLKSLLSIMGYLLHTYKDPSFPRAVIFMDPSNEINPNGRTGKGLICKALGHIRKLAKEDGKFFGMREKYAFSLVDWDTKIFQLDDVKKNFDFESLFPAITEGIRVEKKYENKFYIPFSQSPKVVLTTNYTIHGEGHSHEGRKIEFELSEYFDAEHTPVDQFNRRLFNDWGEADWNKFYALMIDCIKLYLAMGIIDPPEVDTNLKRLKQETPPEFLSFMYENISTNQRYDKKVIFNLYCSKNPGTDLLIQKTFTSWIKLYANAKGFEIKEPHSGNTEYFILAEKS